MSQSRRFSQPSGRSETEVFSDLAALSRRPGYAHAIAYLCYQNNIVGFKEELTAEVMLKQYSNEHVIRSEIATLIGLFLQGEMDLTLPRPEVFQEYVSKSEALLAELHHCLAAEMMRSIVDPADEEMAHGLGSGKALREPIFYGGESAYAFQYRDFAVERYRADEAWLLANKGFCLEAAQHIARAIERIQVRKILSTYKEMMSRSPDTWTTLPGHFLTADEIASESGVEVGQVERFLQSFAFSGSNAGFRSISDFNEANSSPLIPVGNGAYLLFQQYALMEALYESPFYWMLQDKAYRDQATKNRGAFTEEFSAQRLCRVFGQENVHRNVKLVASGGAVTAEVDVLVVFGDRLIVLQAKSKRLTIEARKGNDGVIQDDFRKAIQNSYGQAYACASHLLDGRCKLVDSGNNALEIEVDPKEVFLFCVVSDHYPALSFQVRQFLNYDTTHTIRAPFVMDLFFLDALTEMLETPLRLLSYVRQRVGYTARLSVTHELTALSYHLKNNLWLEDEMQHVTLGEDISVDLDLAMSVRRDGVPGARTPAGILTALVGTPLGRIIERIELMQDPDTIDVGFAFLTLSGDTCRAINEGLRRLSDMVRADGHTHDMSIGFPDTEGLTFHCSAEADPHALLQLLGHCNIKKYSRRADKWIGLCVDTDFNLRFGITIDQPWERSEEMEQLAAEMLLGK